MMSRGLFTVAALCAVLLGTAAQSFAVNECCALGGSCLSSSGFPYAATTVCPGGNVCGCTIYGTNCQARLTADVSTSSGSDCLTLGKGVDFNLNDHTFNCTGSDCGRAIMTNSFLGTGTTNVRDGFVTGCFDVGVYGTSGLTTTIDNMSVALGRSCTNGISISGTLRNIGLFSNSDITNSQVHDTEWGIFSTGDFDGIALKGNAVGIWTAGNNISSALFDGNDVAIEEGTNGLDVHLSKSMFASSVNCHRSVGGSCQSDLEGGHILVTGTDPIIVCDPSGDATRVCTFR